MNPQYWQYNTRLPNNLKGIARVKKRGTVPRIPYWPRPAYSLLLGLPRRDTYQGPPWSMVFQHVLEHWSRELDVRCAANARLGIL